MSPEDKGELGKTINESEIIELDVNESIQAESKVDLDNIVEKTDEPEEVRSDKDLDETVDISQIDDVEVAIEKKFFPSEEHTTRSYSLLSKLGQGAMGEIVMARDLDLQRKVAYKKILPQMAAEKKVLDNFLTEAQITAQLEHPSIVPIYGLEVNQQGNIAYSMKMIKGKTLGDLIDEAKEQFEKYGRVDEEHSLTSLLEHFLKVCDAVHYAHMKGIIHRDLKPDNIMIGPYNEVYLMDWGIARTFEAVETNGKTEEELIEIEREVKDFNEMEKGRVIGTPRYMSPQQAAGLNHKLSGSSDQFALGLILYELVTLKQAFSATRAVQLLKKVLKAAIDPMEHFHPKGRIPTELEAIIEKATSRKTPQRYHNVEDFADDIRRYLRGEAVFARPDTFLQTVLRWMSKHRLATLGMVMSLLLFSATLVILTLYNKQMALIAAQEHERKLNHFLTSVAHKSQTIDSHFTEFEAILEGLGEAAIQLYNEGKDGEHYVYTSKDNSKKATRAPDMTFSKFYNMPISTDWLVYKLAPGINKEDMLVIMKRMSPLRNTFRRLFLKSHNENSVNLTSNQARSLIMSEGVPLIWAYVGLENGVHISYPGKTGYPEAYDPRQRPWYKNSIGQHGERWLKPYTDVGGKGLLLPCTLPLYSKDNQLLGVAGVEMTFDYIIHNMLDMNMTGVDTSYLLNESGEIVVSSKDKLKKVKAGTLDNTTKKLKLFPHQTVLASVKNKTSGYILEKGTLAHEKLLAYYRIPTIGYYYLVEVNNEKTLLDAIK